MEVRPLLHAVADHAADWLESLPERPVAAAATEAELHLADALPAGSLPVDQVVADLVRTPSPASPRWARRASTAS